MENVEKPIRVAQIFNRMDHGGIESVVMNYYRNIDHSKVQFDFYFEESSTLPQRAEIEQLGGGLYPLPAYSKVFAYQKSLQKALKEGNYHIVHSHLSTMSVFALYAAWRVKVPTRICHNHSTAEKGEGKKTIFKYILRPFSKIFATHYFACGNKAACWMYGKRLVDSGKATILPNAVDVNRFKYSDELRTQLRNEYGIPQDAKVVGHVGRFTYPKNHRLLLEIFKHILENEGDGEKYYLLLVGTGELFEEIRMLAEPIKDRVIFTGERNDANHFYSVMDVFCLPSFYEGMPVVAWEAQANGLCCIFSDKVTAEAAILPRCKFLKLNDADAVWTETIMECSHNRMKSAAGDIPDIHEWAKWLQQFYLSVK